MSIKQEYQKQRKRVQSLLRSYIKKGYEVEVELPKLVKKPTRASINRLKKITPDVVRRQSFLPDIETGEKINYYQQQIRYPKKRQKKEIRIHLDGGIYTDTTVVHDWQVAYDNAVDIFKQYPERSADLILSKVASLATLYSEEAVGKALKEMFDADLILSPSEGYNYRAVLNMGNELMVRLGLGVEEQEIITADLLRDAEIQEEYEGEFESWY